MIAQGTKSKSHGKVKRGGQMIQMPAEVFVWVQGLIDSTGMEFRVPPCRILEGDRTNQVSLARRAVVLELRSGKHLIVKRTAGKCLEFKVLKDGARWPAETGWRKPPVTLVADIVGGDHTMVVHMEKRIRSENLPRASVE